MKPPCINPCSCAPAQINLYVPETQHNSFGVVRSLVTDSQDNNTGATAQTFIDSDGQVGNDSARDSTAFMDGRWHMVRVLTDSTPNSDSSG